MALRKKLEQGRFEKVDAGLLELRRDGNGGQEPDPGVHILRRGVVCETESRGHATPGGRRILEIVLDASEGFIPLWAKDSTLRWRFRESSFKPFKKPAALKTRIRELFAEAVLAWGDAVPVKFSEHTDVYDFEIMMRGADNCNVNGCVLASAFFPDPGRHQLRIYPKLFTLSRQEQVETMIHEIGHIFGLRHFFAQLEERDWPSQVFGTHSPFSIMNYGANSVLTNDDKADLKRLYQLVWKGELTQINGTPIRLVKPFHTIGMPDGVVAFVPTEAQPLPKAATLC